MSANDRQEGGDHYRKRKVQHWDYACQLPYLEASVSKYIDRWRDKGDPLENLKKAGHYLQKLIEVNFPNAKVTFAVTLTESDYKAPERSTPLGVEDDELPPSTEERMGAKIGKDGARMMTPREPPASTLG